MTLRITYKQMVQFKDLACFTHMLTKFWYPMTAKEHQGNIKNI